MKTLKYLSMALLAVACFVGFTACSNDDDEKNPATEKGAQTYIGIQDANYQQGALPGITDSDIQITSTANSSALAGGANIVSVSSPVELQKFYVGIDGLDGYFELPATEATRADATVYLYNFIITYTTGLDRDLTIIVNAQTTDNRVVGVSRQTVTYVESQTGDLTINLVFDQKKDVDLHLFLPEESPFANNWVYYGNRGIYIDGTDIDALEEALWDELLTKYGYSADTDEDDIENDEFWMEYETRYEELYTSRLMSGLDHDSNPSCSIDGLNNENIVIKAQHLVAGTYMVYVNMYSNCDSENPTKWTCITRFNGNLISVTEGANPASGEFVADAYSNNNDEVEKMTLATTFTLTQEQINAAQASTRATFNESSYALASISQKSMLKMMDSGRWDNMRHHRRVIRR